MNWLSLHQIHKDFGVKKVLEDLTFGVSQGQKIGIIGANGSGKSTLMRIIMDLEKPDRGTVHRNKSINFAYLSQEPDLLDENTVFQEVLSERSEELKLLEDFHQLSAALDSHDNDLEKLERLQERMETGGCWDLENKVKQYLHQVGIHNLQTKISSLSGGEKKKIALAKLFINKADFLLLDEPTNHLDTQTIEWLEEMLQNFEGALLMITHDRYFLTRVTDGIADLRKGRMKFYPGDYQKYLQNISQEQHIEYRTQKNILSFISRELQWVQKMPRARGTKANSRLKTFDKASQTAIRNKAQSLKPMEEFQFGLHQKLGNTILEWGQLGKKYENWMFRNSSHKVLEGEKIGIIGRNGAGKSTFIKVIMQQVKPDEGWIQKGINTEFCYFDQDRLALRDDDTVQQTLAEYGDYILLDRQRLHISAYLERFHFPRETFRKKVKILSGGEKARLLLAKLVASRGNFLILDEPTNDLDLDTLRILEEAISAYQGCAFIVSHDRYFLDRVCNSILEISDTSPPLYSSGNYTQFQSLKQAQKVQSVGEHKSNRSEGKSPRERKKKAFGFKETRELEALEVEIEALEEKINEIQKRLEGPLEPEEYRTVSEEFQFTKTSLERAYERWEILESLKEAEGT